MKEHKETVAPNIDRNAGAERAELFKDLYQDKD